MHMKRVKIISKSRAFLTLPVIWLTACVTSPAPLPVVEIPDYQADFNVAEFDTLPRNIDAFRAEFGESFGEARNCSRKRQLKAEHIDRITSFSVGSGWALGAINSIGVAFEDELATGSVDVAERLIATGRGIANLENDLEASGILDSYQARLDTLLAQQSFTRTLFNFRSAPPESLDAMFYHAAVGTIGRSEGQFQEAEFHFKEAIKFSKYSSFSKKHINPNSLYEELVSVLIRQDRLVEAEAFAREAIKRTGIGQRAQYFEKPAHEVDEYNGVNAGPVSMLALVLLEQGRIDDALYVARIAVNMHEVGCSLPTSLGLNRSRLVLINVLTEAREWEEVLFEIERVRSDLSGFPDLFNTRFASSFDYAEALIQTGNPDAGLEIITARLADEAIDPGTSAVGTGLIGIARASSGDTTGSLPFFAEAFETLIENPTAAGSDVSKAKADRILVSYLDALETLITENARGQRHIGYIGEALRVSNALKTGRVQNAFSAGKIRASLGDPTLAKLVRDEQDYRVEYEQLAEVLVQAEFLPQNLSKPVDRDRIQKRIAELRAFNDGLAQQIEQQFPQYNQLINPKPISIAEIQSELNPGQTLVSYHVLKDRLLIWAVPKTGEVSFAVSDISAAGLQRQIGLLRGSVDPTGVFALRDIPDFDLETSFNLHQVLLAPVAASLSDTQELLVVPDGAIGSLPFALLTISKTGKIADDTFFFDRYRDVDWLVREMAIIQLPSESSLRTYAQLATPEPSDSKRAFLGFGDPYFSLSQQRDAEVASADLRGAVFRDLPENRGIDLIEYSLLPRLADTRDEIESIARTLSADLARDTFLGERASETNVTSADLAAYNVISFATHGLVPGDLNGLYEPALALTNPRVTGEQEDGLLTLTEVLALRLDADLVILSACNTAASDNRSSETVSGLGRAFFYAGARSIMASNWPVSSSATTAMMIRVFETRKTRPQASLAEAYRDTQVQMIDQALSVQTKGISYAHPIFWAPFSLVGEGG